MRRKGKEEKKWEGEGKGKPICTILFSDYFFFLIKT